MLRRLSRHPHKAPMQIQSVSDPFRSPSIPSHSLKSADSIFKLSYIQIRASIPNSRVLSSFKLHSLKYADSIPKSCYSSFNHSRFVQPSSSFNIQNPGSFSH
ncbi:hypothetical protein QL285_000101 [Trifolium repens]|nr:hypothetical protein QL285_000101 [Trifolium repens]